ncbi:ATP-binding protein, partial [Escherichia coli]
MSIEFYRTSDRWLSIDIHDTGKGMSKQLQQQIFTPGVTTKRRGWGIGLSLSKRVIEQYHKGQLYIKQSEPGVGTTFTINLPV